MKQSLGCSGAPVSAALSGRPTINSSPRIRVLSPYPTPLRALRLWMYYLADLMDVALPDPLFAVASRHHADVCLLMLCTYIVQALRIGNSCIYYITI